MFKSIRHNTHLKREHIPLSTVKKNMDKMSEATVFSRLEAKKGFYQIFLSEKSSKLATFNNS